MGGLFFCQKRHSLCESHSLIVPYISTTVGLFAFDHHLNEEENRNGAAV